MTQAVPKWEEFGSITGGKWEDNGRKMGGTSQFTPNKEVFGSVAGRGFGAIHSKFGVAGEEYGSDSLLIRSSHFGAIYSKLGVRNLERFIPNWELPF